MKRNFEACLGLSAMTGNFQTLVNNYIDDKNINHVALSVSGGTPESTSHWAAQSNTDTPSGTETFTANSPYFIASTSKLYATAIIMQLRRDGLLKLDDPLSRFFNDEEIGGIHVLDGVDRSSDITIRQLLAHTSGLADYFEGKRQDGTRFADQLLSGADAAWSVPDVLSDVRSKLKPRFIPGTKGKAYYSDTNYQLLGHLIEKITQKNLPDNVKERITEPLGMADTYLYTIEAASGRAPVLPLQNGSEQVSIPLAMQSVRLDGGVVSTSADSLLFIEAFIQGKLFPEGYIEEIQQWNSILFPLKAGVGLLKFQVPKFMAPFGNRHSIIGHSGISGAFAFYSPTSGMYLAGTVNQLKKRQSPYQLMLKAIAATEKCAKQYSP